jgi:hypothetical protein
MEPQPLQTADWVRIGAALVHLYLFLAFAVVAATATLLWRAVIPSLVESADAPAVVLSLRRVLAPLGVIAALLMLVALVEGLLLAYTALSQLFPRFGV